jgi:hypothetical protein
VSWSRKLDEPIPLPDGRTLVSLHDAANFITALSKEEVALPEWQAAIEALMLVVEQKRPLRCSPGLASGITVPEHSTETSRPTIRERN